MTINQLFKKKPSQVMIIEFLNLLNILSFDDARYFSKKDIENSMIILELQKKSKMFEILSMNIFFEDILLIICYKFILNFIVIW